MGLSRGLTSHTHSHILKPSIRDFIPCIIYARTYVCGSRKISLYIGAKAIHILSERFIPM